MIPAHWQFKNDEERRDAAYLTKAVAEYQAKSGNAPLGKWYAQLAETVAKNAQRSASIAAEIREQIGATVAAATA
jgi:hypothetical protein